MQPEDWKIGTASLDMKPLLYMIDVSDTGTLLEMNMVMTNKSESLTHPC